MNPIITPAALSFVSRPSQRSRTVAIIAALVALVVSLPPARAAFVLTLSQSGGNVTVTGSGSLNLAALTNGGTSTFTPQLYPGLAIIGAGTAGDVGYYNGMTGPSSFGSFTQTYASATSGSVIGILGINGSLYTPLGYASGTVISDTATFANATFSSLGFTPGTYTYTWGSGSTADSFTVTSVSDVPEPTTWLGGALLLGAAGLTVRHRRRAAGGSAAQVPHGVES